MTTERKLHGGQRVTFFSLVTQRREPGQLIERVEIPTKGRCWHVRDVLGLTHTVLEPLIEECECNH